MRMPREGSNRDRNPTQGFLASILDKPITSAFIQGVHGSSSRSTLVNNVFLSLAIPGTHSGKSWLDAVDGQLTWMMGDAVSERCEVCEGWETATGGYVTYRPDCTQAQRCSGRKDKDSSVILEGPKNA